jgi:hypothetical protein
MIERPETLMDHDLDGASTLQTPASRITPWIFTINLGVGNQECVRRKNPPPRASTARLYEFEPLSAGITNNIWQRFP